jgi:hypothetical protein
MKSLQRRLAKLERERHLPARSPITAVALDTGGDNLMAIRGEWLPCPDVAAVLEECDAPLKVYLGFDPREVLACPPRD